MSHGFNLTEDQLLALRSGDVQLYLKSRGWEPATTRSPRGGLIFHNSKFRGAETLVPLDRGFKDFSHRMGDLIVTLAALEKRAVSHVINDLSGSMSDALRLRVVSSDASLGSVPLAEGLRLLKGGQDLLRSAAYSVEKPESLHPQHNIRPVQEFLNGCRLGQTEFGSFVATILTPPVPPELATPHALPFPEKDVAITDPFVRRVTNGLMGSLATVSNALESGSLGSILDEASKGISANLFEALGDMEPRVDQSSLDISVNWARSRPINIANPSAIISLTKDHFPVLKEAARSIRERSGARRLHYDGQVLELRTSSRDLFSDDGGRVVILTRVEGRQAKIKADLSTEDYAKACDAHRDRRAVRVSGLIRQDEKNNVFVLSDPRDFQMLEEATPRLLDSSPTL